MSDDILSLPPPPADERIPYGAHPLQFGDLRLPTGEGPHPLVAFIHGGFWRARYDLTHTGHLCEALREAGIATWNIEYRRLGDPYGGWPGTFQDVAQATDYVRHLLTLHPLDSDRIVAAGHSAGGQLALWLAGRHRLPTSSPLYLPDPLQLRGAATLAGVVNLREAWELRLSNGVVRDLLGGTPEEIPERYSQTDPAELLPLGVPQALVHGTSDRNVPFALSTGYLRRAIKAGDQVRLFPLLNLGHFAPIDPCSPAWPAVLAALDHLLS